MPTATTQSRSNLADHSTVERAERQLERCGNTLAGMSDMLAEAKQVIEYDSDRRKRALADVMAVLLDEGDSAAAAECKARASKQYGEAFIHLGMQLRDALRVTEKAVALKIQWESARSLLSMERAKVNML